MVSITRQHKQRVLAEQAKAAPAAKAKPAGRKAKKAAKQTADAVPQQVASTNPAVLHKQRTLEKLGKIKLVSAAEKAAKKPAPAPAGKKAPKAHGKDKGQQDVLLAALDEDLTRLGEIEAISDKRTLKAELLEKYLPHVEAYMASGARYQNPVLVYCVIWLLDCERMAQAIELADVAIAQNQRLPERFKRPLSEFVVEEFSEWAAAQSKAKQSASPAIDQVIERMEANTWPVSSPIIRGKLYVYAGDVRDALGEEAEALALFEKAQEANDQAGRKTRIKKLQGKLKK